MFCILGQTLQSPIKLHRSEAASDSCGLASCFHAPLPCCIISSLLSTANGDSVHRFMPSSSKFSYINRPLLDLEGIFPVALQPCHWSQNPNEPSVTLLALKFIYLFILVLGIESRPLCGAQLYSSPWKFSINPLISEMPVSESSQAGSPVGMQCKKGVMPPPSDSL